MGLYGDDGKENGNYSYIPGLCHLEQCKQWESQSSPDVLTYMVVSLNWGTPM